MRESVKQLRSEIKKTKKKRLSVTISFAIIFIISILILFWVEQNIYTYDDNYNIFRSIFISTLLFSIFGLILFESPIISMFIYNDSIFSGKQILFPFKKLFCPHCKKYIEEQSYWKCESCDYHSNKGIYAFCSNCKTNSDLLYCPFCEKEFEIGNNLVPGQAKFILEKSRLSEFFEGIVSVVAGDKLNELQKKVDLSALQDELEVEKFRKEINDLKPSEKIKEDPIEELKKKQEEELKKNKIRREFIQRENLSDIEFEINSKLERDALQKEKIKKLDPNDPDYDDKLQIIIEAFEAIRFDE